MTLEELKKKYKALSDIHAERGKSYEAKGDKEREQGNFDYAKLYYDMGTEEFKKSTIYTQFVNDLNKVTK